MIFKYAECPECNKKLSFWGKHFSILQTSYNCSHCNLKIKWNSIIGLYLLIGCLIWISIFFLIKDLIDSPYLAILIGFILAHIVLMLFPKRLTKVVRNKWKRRRIRTEIR